MDVRERERELEEIDRWCAEREEAEGRARRRVGRFVSPELPVEAFFGELAEEEQGLIRWLMERRPRGASSLTLDQVFEHRYGKKLDVLWVDKMQALGLIEEVNHGRLARALGDGILPRVRVYDALAEAHRGPTARRG